MYNDVWGCAEILPKNDPLKMKCVRTVDKALINKNQI